MGPSTKATSKRTSLMVGADLSSVMAQSMKETGSLEKPMGKEFNTTSVGATSTTKEASRTTNVMATEKSNTQMELNLKAISRTISKTATESSTGQTAKSTTVTSKTTSSTARESTGSRMGFSTMASG